MDEDYYVLVFFVERTHVFENAQLEVYVKYYRTRYEVNGGVSVRQSCSLTDTEPSCWVSVPLQLSDNETAFLTLSPMPDTTVDWINDRVFLKMACVPRAWMYTVISLAVLIGLAGISITMIVVCICVNKERTIPPEMETLLEQPPPVVTYRYTFIRYVYRIRRVRLIKI